MSAHPALTSAAIQRFFSRSEDSSLESHREISNPINSGTEPDYANNQWQPNAHHFVVISTKTAPAYTPEAYARCANIETVKQNLCFATFCDSRNYVGISERKALAKGKALKNSEVIRDLECTPELPSYLLKIYNLEIIGQHRAASKVVFQFIETHFSSSNLAAVNALLEAIDLKKLSPWSIAGLVRFTSRAKSHLPYWSTVFAQAKKTLTDKGHSAEKILIGIKG